MAAEDLSFNFLKIDNKSITYISGPFLSTGITSATIQEMFTSFALGSRSISSIGQMTQYLVRPQDDVNLLQVNSYSHCLFEAVKLELDLQSHRRFKFEIVDRIEGFSGSAGLTLFFSDLLMLTSIKPLVLQCNLPPL